MDREPIHSELIVQGPMTCDAVDLFMFSAACKLPHRIHYDEGFARSEGLDGLPVHGPLQGARLTAMISFWARERGGRIVELEYRNVAPLYAGQEFKCVADLIEEHTEKDVQILRLAVRVLSADTVFTSGEAVAKVKAGSLDRVVSK